MREGTGQPLIDAAGTEHRPVGEGARIISLVPSLTELLFDLGLGGQVVGRTAFCTEPAPAVERVTSVGGTKSVQMARLLSLGASHVLVNIDETPKVLADRLTESGLTVVVTHPIAVRDNLALYLLLGGLFGRQQAAVRLCDQFEQALERLAAAALPARRVAYLIWKDPWMTVSRETYISHVLAAAGMDTGDWPSGDRYPTVEWTDPLLAGFDLILFATEPFAFTGDHLRDFAAERPGAAHKLRLIDGQMLSWYGSRAVQALDYLTRWVPGP